MALPPPGCGCFGSARPWLIPRWPASSRRRLPDCRLMSRTDFARRSPHCPTRSRWCRCEIFRGRWRSCSIATGVKGAACPPSWSKPSLQHTSSALALPYRHMTWGPTSVTRPRQMASPSTSCRRTTSCLCSGAQITRSRRLTADSGATSRCPLATWKAVPRRRCARCVGYGSVDPERQAGTGATVAEAPEPGPGSVNHPRSSRHSGKHLPDDHKRRPTPQREEPPMSILV